MTDLVLFDLDPEMTETDWVDVGEQIAVAERDLPWMTGDWILHGTTHYRDGRDQACKILSHLAESTVARYEFVASRFPKDRRVNISFWHHSECAALPPPEADKILQRAITERLTQKDVRNIAQQVKAELKGRMPELDSDRTRRERQEERRRWYVEYYELREQAERTKAEYVKVPKELFLALEHRIPKVDA